MNSVQIAKMVIDNGYLTDEENRNEDNSINWNFVSADVHIDSPLEFTHEAEENAYDLLQECINNLEGYLAVVH
jgi:signal transduction histidine kinase